MKKKNSETDAHEIFKNSSACYEPSLVTMPFPKWIQLNDIRYDSVKIYYKGFSNHCVRKYDFTFIHLYSNALPFASVSIFYSHMKRFLGVSSLKVRVFSTLNSGIIIWARYSSDKFNCEKIQFQHYNDFRSLNTIRFCRHNHAMNWMCKRLKYLYGKLCCLMHTRTCTQFNEQINCR